MCKLIPADVYRDVIQYYQPFFKHPSPIGITEKFAANLLKYSRSTFRETYIRPFRELVQAQYKKFVPFDYHISYDITDQYIDNGKLSALSFDALVVDYVRENLTLAELSILTMALQDTTEVITCVGKILPTFLYSRNSCNNSVRNIYTYINAHILNQDNRHIETKPDLRYETCHDHGYRWIANLPYRYTPDMRPHHLKELLEYANDGYVFGEAHNTSNASQQCGIYRPKIKKETACVFDTLV